MIYRLALCLFLGFFLAACEEAPPPVAPAPVPHVSGFPAGHPLSSGTVND